MGDLASVHHDGSSHCDAVGLEITAHLGKVNPPARHFSHSFPRDNCGDRKLALY
jgi:hypothetical protein